MLVPTGLLVEDQPPVVTVDMQKSAALPVIKQTFFSHVIPSFLDDRFHVVNLIPNPPKVYPVRKFSGVLNAIGIILRFNPATEQQGITSNGVNPFMKGWVITSP